MPHLPHLRFLRTGDIGISVDGDEDYEFAIDKNDGLVVVDESYTDTSPSGRGNDVVDGWSLVRYSGHKVADGDEVGAQTSSDDSIYVTYERWQDAEDADFGDYRKNYTDTARNVLDAAYGSERWVFEAAIPLDKLGIDASGLIPEIRVHLTHTCGNDYLNVTSLEVQGEAPIPEPATVALIGLGLIGLQFGTSRLTRKYSV